MKGAVEVLTRCLAQALGPCGIFTATPGSDSYQKLQLLSVIGARSLDPTPP